MSETILQEAQRLVHGDRGATYGHPIEDYTCTGRMWAAILDRWLRAQPGFNALPRLPDIDPRIAALMMVAVKASREAHRPKRDNRTDMAGYAECVDMIAQRQGAEPGTLPAAAPPVATMPRIEDAPTCPRCGGPMPPLERY